MESIDVPKNVSVIIPVFEAAGFIVGTLETVAAQTFLPLEVVIVDDGSSDNTCDVIAAFACATPLDTASKTVSSASKIGS